MKSGIKLFFFILTNSRQDYLKTAHIDFKLTDDNVFERLAKISGVQKSASKIHRYRSQLVLFGQLDLEHRWIGL